MAGVQLSPAELAKVQGSGPGDVTNYTWAVWVLQDLGAPVTDNNVNNLVSWMLAENAADTWTGTAGANNPLNNGLGSGGGAGLGSYPDLGTAAQYAAKGVTGGISGASPIGAALMADAPFSIFHAATIASGWASSHYSGSFWATESGPGNPPAVSASSSAKNGATKGVNTGGAGGGIVGGIANAGITAGSDVVHAFTAWADVIPLVGHLLSDVLSVNYWKRIGIFTGGLVLVVVGTLLFVSTTKTGERMESTAETAAVVGAAA